MKINTDNMEKVFKDTEEYCKSTNGCFNCKFRLDHAVNDCNCVFNIVWSIMEDVNNEEV